MNKILLVAALAITILGSIATIQTAEALCPEHDPLCCPPGAEPICGLVVTDQGKFDCTVCGDPFEKFVHKGLILADYRNTKLLEAIQVQGTQITNLQKEVDSMKGIIIVDGKVDRYSGGIIIDGIIVTMLGAVITIGLVNLMRKR